MQVLFIILFFSDARDERRGWMGDASLTADEALYNFDLIKFYHNFLNLIVDNQLNNGELPN
jgi:alpha-L-rhamnosidase